jgi:hypothetical protein
LIVAKLTVASDARGASEIAACVASAILGEKKGRTRQRRGAPPIVKTSNERQMGIQFGRYLIYCIYYNVN